MSWQTGVKCDEGTEKKEEEKREEKEKKSLLRGPFSFQSRKQRSQMLTKSAPYNSYL